MKRPLETTAIKDPCWSECMGLVLKEIHSPAKVEVRGVFFTSMQLMSSSSLLMNNILGAGEVFPHLVNFSFFFQLHLQGCGLPFFNNKSTGIQLCAKEMNRYYNIVCMSPANHASWLDQAREIFQLLHCCFLPTDLPKRTLKHMKIMELPSQGSKCY